MHRKNKAFIGVPIRLICTSFWGTGQLWNTFDFCPFLSWVIWAINTKLLHKTNAKNESFIFKGAQCIINNNYHTLIYYRQHILEFHCQGHVLMSYTWQKNTITNLCKRKVLYKIKIIFESLVTHQTSPPFFFQHPIEFVTNLQQAKIYIELCVNVKFGKGEHELNSHYSLCQISNTEKLTSA